MWLGGEDGSRMIPHGEGRAKEKMGPRDDLALGIVIFRS
jgi:hypothetical protein